jgi:23S rRNA (cytidine1920-2'-O)/16S rRNA (cytidine1409-2'-O)-methyltransferase
LAKLRLDQELVRRGLVTTRSQAKSYINLGKVLVGGQVTNKTVLFVAADTEIKIAEDEQFVSRAALKLKSVAGKLGLDFAGKTVLDVGSSTGGFTDFVLKRGARKVIAVDVGTNQLHASLRGNPKIEVHEKTDIRAVATAETSRASGQNLVIEQPDIIVIDVSFISLRDVLPHVAQYLATPETVIVAMVKPQFETGGKVKNAGVVKNDTARRQILRDFETWAKARFVIKGKADSDVAGARGNRERFYLLNKMAS